MVLNGCRSAQITVPNTEACTVAGVVAAGGFCAESVTGATRDMTVDEWFDFIEPADERPNPDKPGEMLPARAGAVCQSTADYGAQKTTLEQACRVLGRNCTYELKAAIATMDNLMMRAHGMLP
jgi:hypothetical protein